MNEYNLNTLNEKLYELLYGMRVIKSRVLDDLDKFRPHMDQPLDEPTLLNLTYFRNLV